MAGDAGGGETPLGTAATTMYLEPDNFCFIQDTQVRWCFLFARQLDEIGSRSLPLVALGAAIGAVLALETRSSLVQFGAKSMLPAAIVFSIIHETGPVVTGLVVSGRVGAGIGAELGSMKVTEQIDAIEASGVNPYKFLAFTRIVASIGMTGDAQKNLVLTQARAMVVRDYLVGNFSFDDAQLKTLALGKGKSLNPDSGWGSVEIIVYPDDTEPPTQSSVATPR